MSEPNLFIILLVIFSCGAIIFPAVSADTFGNLEYDDILKMDSLRHFALTSDEENIVYLLTTGDDLTPPADNGTLMMVNTSTGTTVTLTGPDESVAVWALSSLRPLLAYVSMPRNGGNKTLTLLDISTMQLEKKEGVSDELLSGFSWLGDHSLVYSGSSPATPEDTRPGDVVIMDAIPDPVILKSYDIRSGAVTELTSNTDVIYAYYPSPDGRYVAYKSSIYPEVWIENPSFTYYVLDTTTGTEDEVMTRIEGFEDENEFAWSPDSSTVFIELNLNGGLLYPVQYASDIAVYTPATGTLEEIPLQWEKKMHKDLFNSDVEMTPFDGGVYVLLADGSNPKLARYEKIDTGWIMTLLSGEHQGNIFALETSPDGSRLYYNYNSASIPPQIYAANILSGEIKNPKKLTNLNENLLQKSLGTSEVIEWTGAKGDTVQGILRYPPGYAPGTPYPLVFVIHGGPTYTDFDSWRDTWEFPYHLITDRGAITLSTNYHGSSNWGFEFAQSIEGGHIHDLPIEDFMKGIAYLSDNGIIDKNRIGVTGWSNGGILTLYWITQDPSLRVAVAGAGYADENSQVSNTNGIVMNRMYHEYTPFENPEYYLPIMGVYNADNVETPLLMLQGTEDNSVAPASALSTYRAYKMASKADVRMILFKGQPHHMKTYPNQLRKVSEEIDWLSKGLGLS